MNRKRLGLGSVLLLIAFVVVYSAAWIYREIEDNRRIIDTNAPPLHQNLNPFRNPSANPGADSLGPDMTADDLVMAHDLIVVGVITGFLGSFQQPASDELAREIGEFPTETWEQFFDMQSSFGVDVEQVLLDRDGAFAAAGSRLVITDPWGPPYHTETTSRDGYVRIGDRYLMVLSKVVGEEDYVMWNGPADRIIVDEADPVDSMGQEVPSAAGMTTEEFMQAVREAIAREYPTPTP